MPLWQRVNSGVNHLRDHPNRSHLRLNWSLATLCIHVTRTFMVRVWLVSIAFFLGAQAQASDLSRPIDATGDPRLDGILSTITWRSSSFKFAFPDSPFDRQPSGVMFAPLGDEQRRIIRSVFMELEQLTLLKFAEAADANESDLTFAR